MLPLFLPHFRFHSVVEITPEVLGELRIKSLLLDVDCTLKQYRGTQIAPGVTRWLDTMKAAGIGLCLVSNGKAGRIRPFAESVDIPFIAPALKPLPLGCNRAVNMMGFDKASTVMVGDQVFTDIVAGKWAGLRTILVSPMNPEAEPWFARIKRPLEKLVLGKNGIPEPHNR